jgi:aspartate kinase
VDPLFIEKIHKCVKQNASFPVYIHARTEFVAVVLKFGGTSVATIPRIKRVAQTVAERHRDERIVVVVSAMAGVTDQLNGYLEKIGAMTSEDDVVLSSGEQITMALLSIALSDLGHSAKSFLGWQLPIVTDDCHRNARITSIETASLCACFAEDTIPVIAGFQGITPKNRLTTLGRGGSDTTAVAVAAAIKADRCDIYTDVDGVYTADPRIVPRAQKQDQISYEEMFELSSSGAKVLQARSVELAMRYNVPIKVLSTFIDSQGTDINGKIRGYAIRDGIESGEQGKGTGQHKAVKVDNFGMSMEATRITGIAYKHNIAKVDIKSPSADILLTILENNIPFDLLAQHEVEHCIHLSLIVEIPYVDRIQTCCTIDRNVAAISVVGIGIENDAIALIINTCKNNSIPILAMSFSRLKVSIITTKQNVELAVFVLHSAFFPEQ